MEGRVRGWGWAGVSEFFSTKKSNFKSKYFLGGGGRRWRWGRGGGARVSEIFYKVSKSKTIVFFFFFFFFFLWGGGVGG